MRLKWKIHFTSGKPSSGMTTEVSEKITKNVRGKEKKRGGGLEGVKGRRGGVRRCERHCRRAIRCNFSTRADVSKDGEDSRRDERFKPLCLRVDDGRWNKKRDLWGGRGAGRETGSPCERAREKKETLQGENTQRSKRHTHTRESQNVWGRKTEASHAG